MAVDWQVTATTIYCDAVDEEVTIQVFKDWSAVCSGHRRYREPSPDAAKELERRSKRLGRKAHCEGIDCRRVTGYRQKLQEEESGKSSGSA